MNGQASIMRNILLAIQALCSQPTQAEGPAPRPPAALLQALRPEGLPDTKPMLAETGANDSTATYLAALVEKPAGEMRLVLVHRAKPGEFKVVARSAPIGVDQTLRFVLVAHSRPAAFSIFATGPGANAIDVTGPMPGSIVFGRRAPSRNHSLSTPSSPALNIRRGDSRPASSTISGPSASPRTAPW